MSKRQPSIVDDVVEQLADDRFGVQPWYRTVDPKHSGTLDELLQAWKAGRLGTKRLRAAKVIAKILHDRKIATVGFKAVNAWLEKV